MATGVTSRDRIGPSSVRPPARDALYLYGISERCDPAAAQGLIGVDGSAPVECVPCGSLFCWVSRVARDVFADRLAENMENLDWLAAASVRHQRVVGRLAERLDVLPARFGSVFLSEPSLAQDVNSRAESLHRALGRIRGAEEWGVKLFAAPHSADGNVSARSGREYLQRKSELLAAREQGGPPPETKALAAELDAVAAASTLHPRPATHQPGLVWQASYLVPRTRVKKFHAVLQRFARKLTGVRLETSGPWPPYSFVADPVRRSTTKAAPKAASDRGARPSSRDGGPRSPSTGRRVREKSRHTVAKRRSPSSRKHAVMKKRTARPSRSARKGRR